jgi:hypothetical protein
LANAPRAIGLSRRPSEGEGNMKSLLIADTTREERERIVAESIGNIDGACDGCSPGLVKMYQDYIEGKRELREINMEFNARYTSGATGPERGGCDYAN